MNTLKQRPSAICLMGPTASGKTALAMRLCDVLPCEIISVDSAQVYRGLDIGAAKPDLDELARYPHHLIDIRDPGDPYSAAEFRDDALALMQKIVSKGHIPLLVGGTMLYFRALVNGLADLPSADQKVRDEISKVAQEKGWSGVRDLLAAVDPEAAQRLHENDAQRLQRALEVYMVSGKTLTELQKAQNTNELFPYRYVSLAIAPKERKILHDQIALRCHQMFETGFVDEVKCLYVRGDLTMSLPSIRSVGYRQVWEYLEGRLSKDIVIDKCIIATRQLAKRQLTWLRSWPDIHWLDSLSTSLLSDALAFINSADGLNIHNH